MDFRDLFIDNYVDFKSWKPIPPKADDIERFEIETKKCLNQKSCKIFEVGFGQGHFLIWAKNKGHQVYGTELIPSLVENAKKNGIQVLNVKLQELDSNQTGNEFDLIAAFDILEHLHPEELYNFLVFSYKILKADGYILARFPNGQSPFGRIYQNGDITHVSELSGPKLKQIANKTNFEIVHIQNSARPIGNGIKQKLIRLMLYLLRDLLGFVTAKIFWGEVIPMDPNITVLLKKKIQPNTDIKTSF